MTLIEPTPEREIQEVLEHIRKECLPETRFTGIYNKLAILVLNCFGEDNPQISERLGIKEQTVKQYKSELKRLNLLSKDEKTIFSSDNYALELTLFSLIIQGHIASVEANKPEKEEL